MTASAHTRADERAHIGLTQREGEGPDPDEAAPIIFGFWVFLMADLVLFAVLFSVYAAMVNGGQGTAPGPADLFDLKIPFVETLILLASSLACGKASLALKWRHDRGRLLAWMGLTFLLGAGFLVLELRDFIQLATEKNAPPQASGWLSSYWLLLGTHGLHVAAGMIWLAVIAAQVVLWGLVHEVKLRIMRFALFWHMLDIVWIAIITVVYLFGVQS
ncbi:cytochrome c oxidase subunit 3 [Pseudoroseicyclus aestuarii]|uniref:Cytochrome bo(3) ubiquinol oxidase subunit 3 n=1 Tax=Pseudoroseicyclus aestuarii TaxID=1795041 RepID=A0A318TCY9_9RHOB|nr:cytochrome c oxidase subunit 3 [Pseudoroseicyclus aestuarii]PYE86178.1 cytochrome o ubiquinol oxidase subunit 3 [Pseudoroseicyclus aestuarii]